MPIDELIRTLNEIEESFYKIARYEDRLRIAGLSYVEAIVDLPALLNALGRFPSELENCRSYLRIVDRSKLEAINILISDTELELVLSTFFVRLRLSRERRRPDILLTSLLEAISSVVGLVRTTRSPGIFSSGADISTEQVLTAIHRIRAQLDSFREIQNERVGQDDDIFKPSNVNIEIVAEFIEAAITSLPNSEALSKSDVVRLTAYLESAKNELASDKPSWKDIIGALVIAAALLGGIADAPQALSNVNNAIKYIIGPSVIEVAPRIRIPELPRSTPNDPDYGSDGSKPLST